MKKLVILLLSTVLLIGCSKEENITEIAQKSYQNANEIREEKIHNQTSIEPQKEGNDLKNTQIVNLFNTYEQELDTAIQINNQNKAKDIFITITDFLFYGTEINGITLKDISDSTKETLLTIATKIDIKIDETWPDYKETIKDKTNISINYIKEKYSTLSDSTKENLKDIIGIDNYNAIIEKKDEIKENTTNIFKDTKEVIKDKISKGIGALKEWYESIR